MKLTDCRELKLSNKHFHGLGSLDTLDYDGQFNGEIDNMTSVKTLALTKFIFTEFTFKRCDYVEELILYSFDYIMYLVVLIFVHF